MKIYLASFMQKENFGPGKVISITHGTKPRDIEVRTQFLPVTPPVEVIDQYRILKETNQVEASQYFMETYHAQLESFVTEVEAEAKKENCTVQELLPFKDGDTLCSWERAQYSNYRKTLAPFLEKLGYQVVLN